MQQRKAEFARELREQLAQETKKEFKDRESSKLKNNKRKMDEWQSEDADGEEDEFDWIVDECPPSSEMDTTRETFHPHTPCLRRSRVL